MEDRDQLEQHIGENGLERLMDNLEAIKKGKKEPHKVAEDLNIVEQDLFEFLWRFNDFARDDFFPVLPYNYAKVERTAKTILEDNNGKMEWGSLLDEVSERTGVDTEEIAMLLGDYVQIAERGDSEETDIVSDIN